MKDFKDKVAVVTGAASGIGRAIAAKCLSEGMQVVLADVEETALEETARKFQADGFNSLVSLVTDVGVRTEIETLAEKTMKEFGAVHLLFNNAGVGAGAGPRDTSYDDWEWVINVNLWSVIYGLKTFLPILESQEGECHIVNTASLAGITYGAGSAPYAVSKHGVVALSEALYFDNLNTESNVGISVLCPSYTATNILDSGRNRPKDLPQPTIVELTSEREAFIQHFHNLVNNGLPPPELAEMVFEGIRANRLYIVTSDEANEQIVERSQFITAGENPPALF